MTGTAVNWAGNVRFSAARVHRPGSVDELAAVLRASRRARALGSGHSFSPVAETTGDLISVAGLPAQVEVDAGRRQVTLSAGLRYGELATELQRHGLALANLGSLPHIAVAGACATGTHGSGDRNGALATSVSALTMVRADGETLSLDRAGDPDRFAGAVVALGCLGVVTHLTLDVQPTYQVRQHVYEDLPWPAVLEGFDDLMASAYSVSLFTTWRGAGVDHAWLKSRDGVDPPGPPPRRLLGGRLAERPHHPVPGVDPAYCTEQLGRPGPWHERLPHFRLEFTPSSGDELQSEYLLPRAAAVEGLRSLAEVAGQVAGPLQVCEVRTVAADDLWLSGAYRRDTVAVHFTWVSDPAAVAPAVAAVEDRLLPLGARPHWGKVFAADPATVASRYERLDDFRALRRELDPEGVLGNDFVDRYLGDGPGRGAAPV